MQAASSPYLPPPPQHYYQNIYHIQPLAPQDYELKRQYLTLLPPQQIIEICLRFDVHVPPYIKSTIWPPDITAAIANLQKPTTSSDASTSAPVQKDNAQSAEPIMASLERPSEEPSNPESNSSSTETRTENPQPSDKTADTPAKTTTHTTTQTPASTTPATQPAVPATPSVHQQPPYPQQPYGYPQQASAAYPHAPYYSPPPGYPSYPPSSYPHYPQPVPNGYPPPPGYPPMPSPMYPTPHVPQPPVHQEQGSDDLPSYEEMIVEALQESTDPEGCAPKDLFAWMAARYPVQSNFRPSASQALQKAFKRGRFEKSGNGKYRLSASWEGGSTSRRTTRRPQTQTQSQTSAMANTSNSPFTHAPLVHHHQQTQQAPLQYPGQPYPYPYGGSAPPTSPGYHQAQPQLGGPKSTSGTDKSASTLDPASTVDRDTYEAAQNILKAINFGDLFQIANEGSSDGKKADDVSVDQLTSLLVQAQHAISQSGGMDVVPQVVPHTAPPLPTLSASAGFAVAGGSVSEPLTSVRAELQAQLALLAAQLAELSQEQIENNLLNGEHPQHQVAQSTVVEPLSLQATDEQEKSPSTAPSTVVDPPLMDALLPPGFSLPESQAQLQEQPLPPSQAQSVPHQGNSPPPPTPPPQQQQHSDIPIDPALQGLGGMVGVRSTTPQLTKSEQVTTTSPALGVQPASSASITTNVPSVVAPPSPHPPVLSATVTSRTLVPEPEPEQRDAESNLTGGQTDTDDDDDMEEIA